MGLPVPPLPLSPDAIDRRLAAGARTLEELDPAFWIWYQRQCRMQLFQACCLFGGVGLTVVFVLILMVFGRL